MYLSSAARAALTGFLIFFTPNLVAHAGNFLEDAWGVVTDPVKLKASSSTLAASVERSLIELGHLEGVVNNHAQERLQQIRSIIADALGGTRDVIADAEKRMLAVEQAIYVDAKKLLYEVQCKTEVLLSDQLQRSLAGIIAELNAADPSIRIFGVTIIDLSLKKIIVDDPDKAYRSAREAKLALLSRTINDNSDAYLIVSTYQNLERLARFTRCHYIDQHLSLTFTQEINDLARLSLPWMSFVRL